MDIRKAQLEVFRQSQEFSLHSYHQLLHLSTNQTSQQITSITHNQVLSQCIWIDLEIQVYLIKLSMAIMEVIMTILKTFHKQ